MSMPNESALAVLKSKGRSFYFASHLLGPQQRDRAARLYAFCRRVDDLADEASDPQQAYVTLERLKASLNSSQTDDANVNDMQTLMHDVAIPPEPMQALIEGVQSDLRHRQVRDEAELLSYAYQVAGTVGVMMCRVLDVSTPRAWPFAIDLGIAMQLTNIARDVGEDARMGRVYLPQNWVAGLTAKEYKPRQKIKPSPSVRPLNAYWQCHKPIIKVVYRACVFCRVLHVMPSWWPRVFTPRSASTWHALITTRGSNARWCLYLASSLAPQLLCLATR